MEKYNFSYIKFSSTFRYGISQRFFSRVDASKLVVIIRFFFSAIFKLSTEKQTFEIQLLKLKCALSCETTITKRKKNRIRLTHKYGD